MTPPKKLIGHDHILPLGIVAPWFDNPVLANCVSASVAIKCAQPLNIKFWILQSFFLTKFWPAQALWFVGYCECVIQEDRCSWFADSFCLQSRSFQLPHLQPATHSNVTRLLQDAASWVAFVFFHLKLIITRQALRGPFVIFLSFFPFFSPTDHYVSFYTAAH